MPLVLFKKQKQPVLSRKESLNTVVIKNEKVDEETSGGGDITLTVYRNTDSLLARIITRFFGLPRKKKIILDERGSFIWNCCNSDVTVGDMIQRFSEKYKLNRKEAEVSIVHFVKSLAARGLAGVVVKRDADDNE